MCVFFFAFSIFLSLSLSLSLCVVFSVPERKIFICSEQVKKSVAAIYFCCVLFGLFFNGLGKKNKRPSIHDETDVLFAEDVKKKKKRNSNHFFFFFVCYFFF